MKIPNVIAKYPGITNHSYKWNRTNVRELLRDLYRREDYDYFLLGESEYPLRPWLLTSLEYNPPVNSPEKRYNDAHKSTRVKIECCNGFLNQDSDFY